MWLELIPIRTISVVESEPKLKCFPEPEPKLLCQKDNFKVSYKLSGAEPGRSWSPSRNSDLRLRGAGVERKISAAHCTSLLEIMRIRPDPDPQHWSISDRSRQVFQEFDTGTEVFESTTTTNTMLSIARQQGDKCRPTWSSSTVECPRRELRHPGAEDCPAHASRISRVSSASRH